MRTRTPPLAGILVGLTTSLAAGVGASQEVAEIPFFHAPPGSAALGGGVRFGQSPYFASDNFHRCSA